MDNRSLLVGTLVLAIAFLAGDFVWLTVLARDFYRREVGGLLLAISYATYDLTNLATHKGWSVAVTIVDVMWGAFLSSVAAGFGFAAARQVGRASG